MEQLIRIADALKSAESVFSRLNLRARTYTASVDSNVAGRD